MVPMMSDQDDEYGEEEVWYIPEEVLDDQDDCEIYAAEWLLKGTTTAHKQTMDSVVIP